MKKNISLIIFLLFLFTPWFNGGKDAVPLAIIQVTVLLTAAILYFKDRCFLNMKPPRVHTRGILHLFGEIRRSFTLLRPMGYGRVIRIHPWAHSHGLLRRRIKTSELNMPLFLFMVFYLAAAINSVYFYNSMVSFIYILMLVVLYYILVYCSAGYLNDRLLRLVFVTALLLALLPGRFPNVNLLAGYIVIGIIIGLARLAVQSVEWTHNKKYFKIMLYVLPILVMLYRLSADASRVGIFSLFSGVSCLAVLKYKKRGLIVSAVLLAILLSVFAPGVFRQNQADPYDNQRLNIWKSGIEAIREHPFLGFGPGNFEYGFSKHNFPVTGAVARYGKYTRFAHNEFIQLWAEAGFIPFFIFIWAVGVFFIRGAGRLAVLSSDDKQYWHQASAMAGAAAILAGALVDFNLHLPAVSVTFIFFMAIIMQKEEAQKISEHRIGIVFPIVALGLLGFIVCNFIAYLNVSKNNIQTAVRFAPLNAAYYRLLGNSIPDEKEKLSAYSRMVFLNPQDAGYHQLLGDTYYNNNDLLNTLKEYKLAVEYNPFNPFVFFNLASYYLNRREYGKALGWYQKALQVEPYYIRAAYYAGECYWNTGRKEEAKELYDRVLEIQQAMQGKKSLNTGYEKNLLSFDNSRLYNSFGKYWMSKNAPAKAIAAYEHALAINPAFADAYSNMAGAYYKLKQYKLAEKYMKEASRLDPGNITFIKNKTLIRKEIKS